MQEELGSSPCLGIVTIAKAIMYLATESLAFPCEADQLKAFINFLEFRSRPTLASIASIGAAAA